MKSSVPGEGNPPSGRTRRLAIRCFFIGMVCLIAIETAPRRLNWPGFSAEFSWLSRVKDLVTEGSGRIGLWQGEWPLFAPDPEMNNAWLSAEVRSPERELRTTWNSPYWGTRSTFDKFRQFRFVNYYSRLPYRGAAPIADFTDYQARRLIPASIQQPAAHTGSLGKGLDETQASTLVGGVAVNDVAVIGNGLDVGSGLTRPHWTVTLNHNQLILSLPEDGSLPTPDDTLWISRSVHLATREYVP